MQPCLHCIALFGCVRTVRFTRSQCFLLSYKGVGGTDRTQIKPFHSFQLVIDPIPSSTCVALILSVLSGRRSVIGASCITRETAYKKFAVFNPPQLLQTIVSDLLLDYRFLAMLPMPVRSSVSTSATQLHSQPVFSISAAVCLPTARSTDSYLSALPCHMCD